MVATKPKIDYTAREFQTILAALEEYVFATQPELWTDFFESNLGRVMMELIAYVGDILSFSIDRVAQEVNLSTAKRRSSALRFASSVGYRPSGPTSASVDINVTDFDGGTPTTTQITIVAGTRVSAGSTVFETQQDFVFPIGTTDVTFAVVEGTPQTDQFTGTGTPNQQYTTSNGDVADGSWEVLVNGVLWEETANLLLNQSDDVYVIEYDSQDRLIVRFGDGTYGNIPADGDTIEINYRTTVGEDGNIAGSAINQQITGISGLAPTSTSIRLSVTNPTAASGGSNRETLAHIKRFIPLFTKTVDKAITKADFDTLANEFSGSAGQIGKATALLRDSGTGPRINDVLATYSGLPDGSLGNPYPPIGTIYVVRDLDSAAPSGAGLYRWDGSDFVFVPVPALLAANIVDIYVWAPSGDTFVDASSALKDELFDYLDARTLITVRLAILDGTTTAVDVDMGDVFVDPSYSVADVEAEVTQALTDFFKRPDHLPGSTIRLTDLYEVIVDVDGVDYFDGLSAPTGDVTAGDSELLVIGTITGTFQTTPTSPPVITGSVP